MNYFTGNYSFIYFDNIFGVKQIINSVHGYLYKVGSLLLFRNRKF